MEVFLTMSSLSETVPCPQHVRSPAVMASEGWTRATSAAGVPYYVHHGDQRTSWTHPRLTAALDCIQDCAYVRFAAYRMAAKCRQLRSALLLDTVTLADVRAALAAQGLAAAGAGEALSCDRVAEVLETLLDVGDGSAASRAEPLLSAALMVLDRRRAGAVTAVSLKLLLGLLCVGRLTDRYRFMYAELADAKDALAPAQLGRLLEVAAALAELLAEKETFGRHLIAGTVRSCFGRTGGAAVSGGGVTRDSLMAWLLREPQMLVWVSTLYRLTSAEGVVHSVGCDVCGVKPIVGLCYACLQCLNFYLCQECFFRGRTNRNHKLQHPLQEFCAQWNRRQKTQALLKTLWNKLSGRAGKKTAVLPPASVTVNAAPDTPTAVSNREDEDQPSSSSSEEEDEDLLSRTLLDGTVTHDPQLDSILGHLETENGRLAGELRRLRHVLPPGERLPEAEQQHMQTQLQRLRALVRRRRGAGKQPRTPSPPPRPPHLQSTPMPRFSQLSPIARVPASPAEGALSPINSVLETSAPRSPPLRNGRDTALTGVSEGAANPPPDADETVIPSTEPERDTGPTPGPGGPAPLSFSAQLPDLTEYSLSDLADMTGLGDPEEADATQAPVAPSAAVQDAEEALAALQAEMAPLELAVERGPELWPTRALTATVPLQTAGELLELLADMENLCVTTTG